MKRRMAAMLFSVLLVLQLAVPPAGAAETVYFLATSNEVHPLSDQTMPFWSGGYLYIPASIFTGTWRRYFGISYNYNPTSRTAILYNGVGDHSLIFDLKETYTLDREGNISYPGGILRNGVPFVPAYLVAKYFNFEYSVIEVKHGYLVWLRLPGFGLPDKQFADAATYSMVRRYDEYVKEKAGRDNETPNAPSTPNTASGKRIYLCLEADGTASAMLDALDRYEMQAAFFCTPEFMKNNGALLRRMAATGQAVGILADGENENQSIEEQLREGNQALELATCGKTRLAMVKNGDEAAVQAVQAAGFRCLEADLDRSGYDLRGASNASALLQKISARRGDVTVWLADTASATGMRAFLSAVQDANRRCLAITETA